MSAVRIASYSDLLDRMPSAARAAGMDLVVVRLVDDVHVLYGRCPHRGAPMAEGCLEGDDLVCRAHGWDFRVLSGISAHVDGERLARFTAIVDRDSDSVSVDEDELTAWQRHNPQAFDHDEFLGG
jgi:nitrite reductase/ring-hydroxylating ferredoxin subunit